VTRDLALRIRHGLTTVVSNAYMRKSSVDLGRPDTSHLQHLRTGAWIPLAEIVATDSLKDWDYPKLQTFFAQTSGLGLYLRLADDGAHRDSCRVSSSSSRKARPRRSPSSSHSATALGSRMDSSATSTGG
jgi:hypothetical protein